MALGSRFQAKGESTTTPSKSFYMDRQPARCVRHARQALAIDEARFDFRPEIWMGHEADQTLEQRWFPGVHSNVGGGYVDDGLANVAFDWILREAEALGLVVDHGFTRFYRPFAKDRLYRSEALHYRVIDALRGRFGRGRRTIAQPAGANLSLDPSVFERMAAEPEEYRDLRQRYRPQNVLDYLASLPDLDGFLREMEAKGEREARERAEQTGRPFQQHNRKLPQDARDAIERSRPRPPASAAAAGGHP